MPIGGRDAAELIGTKMGDRGQVMLPILDIPSLPDRGAQVMLRTVTTNALNIVSEHVMTATYERRQAPSVSAIHTYSPRPPPR